MKVTVLSGGVGGARFLRGLVDVVDPAELTVIGNVGDDLEILGLHVSPDLDSILYALAGLSGPTLFAPLYGPGSAERFRLHAHTIGADVVPAVIPNLADDVDSIADLDRLELRVGPRTLAARTR